VGTNEPIAEHGTTPHRGRRRLALHAVGLATLGVACLSLGATTTSAAPTVQEGRYLEGGDIDVAYTCLGADEATISLMNLLQIPSIPLDVGVRSAAVEPSPSQGEDFDMEFTWDFTLGADLVFTAVDNGAASFSISGTESIGAQSGATGPDTTGTTPAADYALGDGTVPVGYSHGPYTGTYNRTAAVDTPIVFKPGNITSTVVVNPLGVTLNLACTPDATVMTLNDQDGVAPSTTTTTSPEVVPTTAGATPTTAAVAGTETELPRTGTSSTLFLAFLGVALVDIGYLALSSGRRGRVSSVH